MRIRAPGYRDRPARLKRKTWLCEQANVCFLMQLKQTVKEYKSSVMSKIVTFCEFVV
ncbi:hypothetical protein OH687_36325 [Burkholderia anthina]|nr:hypothetical protein OH687_36325 [Burkholderia anthina]